MSQTIIKLDSVTKNFEDRTMGYTKQVIRGIDLEIKRGSFNSIIGPSGVGKSTLINLIGGMIKPTTGGVYLDNQAVHLMNEGDLDKYRRTKIGFLWQSPSQNLFSELTAYENVAFSLQINDNNEPNLRKQIDELFRSVGLSHRKNHTLKQLSGGEAQRVGLIAALANSPTVLLADEPTGELDIKTKFEVLDYLSQINEERGITIILVTHDLEIAKHTSFTYRLEDGTISDRTTYRSKGRGVKMEQTEDSISIVDQFGRVKIPNNIRKELLPSRFVRFRRKGDEVYLERVDTDHE